MKKGEEYFENAVLGSVTKMKTFPIKISGQTRVWTNIMEFLTGEIVTIGQANGYTSTPFWF